MNIVKAITAGAQVMRVDAYISEKLPGYSIDLLATKL